MEAAERVSSGLEEVQELVRALQVRSAPASDVPRGHAVCSSCSPLLPLAKRAGGQGHG